MAIIDFVNFARNGTIVYLTKKRGGSNLAVGATTAAIGFGLLWDATQERSGTYKSKREGEKEVTGVRKYFAKAGRILEYAIGSAAFIGGLLETVGTAADMYDRRKA